MRIASQVRHYVLCGGEGRLGIDDPGLLPQRRKKALKGPGVDQRRCGAGELETGLRVGVLQGGQVLATKYAGERFHRKEKVATLGRNPAVPVWGQRPTSH